jgi:hypothetical protein
VRRWVLVVAGVVVIVVGAALGTVALGGGSSTASAQVTCSRQGVRVLTPRVLAQEDGLHLRVVNVGDARRYEVGSEGSTPVAGVLSEDGIVDLRLALAPGEVRFACRRAGTGEWLVGRFELQARDGSWTSDALACADPDSGVFETRYLDEPFEDTARRALPGLWPLDRLLVPGYPETAWHGELHVVLRDDQVVGRVVRVVDHGAWNLSVDACPGSGLTQGAIAETGAT